MNVSSAIRSVAAVAAFSFIAAVPSLFYAAPAEAQDRRIQRERENERHRFQTQHWAWDSRYRHNHYYPAVGYSVPLLPQGHINVFYRGGNYYFHSGVWFRMQGSRYLVVRPPLGLIIPSLPVGYTQVLAGGLPYYYANEVYYTQTPQGYAVVTPPAEIQYQEQEPPQAQAPVVPSQASAAAGQPGQTPGMWYYCDASRAYYPHVATCNEPWRPVPATPPPR